MFVIIVLLKCPSSPQIPCLILRDKERLEKWSGKNELWLFFVRKNHTNIIRGPEENTRMLQDMGPFTVILPCGTGTRIKGHVLVIIETDPGRTPGEAKQPQIHLDDHTSSTCSRMV